MSSAVLVEAPGRFRLVPHEPVPPGPGEALVRVRACGLCGSDRELFRGDRPGEYVRYPVVPGHEWSGTVAEVGAGVPPALVGRAVVGEGFRNCQVCERCRAGDTTLCAAGYAETGFTEPGALAPTLTLPARLLHPLPEPTGDTGDLRDTGSTDGTGGEGGTGGLDLAAAALLEPAACVAAAALAAAALPGQRVAVVGTGTLGLLAVQFLAAASPAHLLAVGAGTGRGDLALRLGATEVRDRADPGPGGYDTVIEAAGSPAAAHEAAALLRRGGRLVLTGIPGAGAVGLDPADLVVRRLEVRTVFGATPAAWAHAVRAFAAGLLTPRALVTHELPLAEYGSAVDLVGSPGTGKILLTP
ncbi:zinc-binding dehydrogenase [Streptomyces sp. NPDC050560]|uniref:zinc-binding dehydrogenase n=1 Tax=Streptomyces sp. NPDC050560 TaxID=3365630 RepID=UPI0037AD455B